MNTELSGWECWAGSGNDDQAGMGQQVMKQNVSKWDRDWEKTRGEKNDVVWQDGHRQQGADPKGKQCGVTGMVRCGSGTRNKLPYS